MNICIFLSRRIVKNRRSVFISQLCSFVGVHGLEKKLVCQLSSEGEGALNSILHILRRHSENAVYLFSPSRHKLDRLARVYCTA